MILIIEGADGSGKTTLANTLRMITGYPVIHNKYEKDKMDQMKGEYLQMIRNNKNLILDRCWYSELCYGPVMRGGSTFDFYDMYELEEAILANGGGLIIYATGPESALWSACQRRGEDFVTSRDDFKQIYMHYKKLMSIPHRLPVVKYEVNH